MTRSLMLLLLAGCASGEAAAGPREPPPVVAEASVHPHLTTADVEVPVQWEGPTDDELALGSARRRKRMDVDQLDAVVSKIPPPKPRRTGDSADARSRDLASPGSKSAQDGGGSAADPGQPLDPGVPDTGAPPGRSGAGLLSAQAAARAFHRLRLLDNDRPDPQNGFQVGRGVKRT